MNIYIVIDMQNDFVTGSLGTPEAQAIVPNIVKALDDAKINNVVYKFIFTKDTHYNDYLRTLEGHYLPIPHCIADTRGWDIVDELRPYSTRCDGHKIFEKNTFGTYDIPKYIQNLIDDGYDIGSINLFGVCTDICVITNALLLRTAFPHKKINVIANCCAGTTPEKHEAALKIMESCQIDII